MPLTHTSMNIWFWPATISAFITHSLTDKQLPCQSSGRSHTPSKSFCALVFLAILLASLGIALFYILTNRNFTQPASTISLLGGLVFSLSIIHSALKHYNKHVNIQVSSFNVSGFQGFKTFTKYNECYAYMRNGILFARKENNGKMSKTSFWNPSSLFSTCMIMSFTAPWHMCNTSLPMSLNTSSPTPHKDTYQILHKTPKHQPQKINVI